MIIECKEELKKVFENISDIDIAKLLTLVVESQMRIDNISTEDRRKFLNIIGEKTGI